MRLEFEKHFKYLEVNGDDRAVIKDRDVNPYQVLTAELGYCYAGLKSCNLNISKKNLEEKFEPVEDFTYVSYSNTIKDFVVYYLVYKSKEKDYYILIDHDLNRDWEECEEKISDNFVALKTLYYKQTSIEVCNDIVKELKTVCEEHDDSAGMVSIVMVENQKTVFKEFPINPLDIDINTMYNDNFKPVHEHIVENLKNGHKGIILLHGDAGSGKTNYIKNLTTLVPKKKFVFVPIGVIPHLAEPSFISLLIENKGSVLVLEDCETFIKDRGREGNTIASTLLNITDGLLSDILDIQIIATFNADINKVDPALRRKGRLIDEYQFGKLTLDKAKKLGESLGVEVTEEMTLSEIYNAKDGSTKIEDDSVTKIGFGFGSR